VPVHERGFGLMFQDFALFPHRDAAQNVGFGLRVRGWAPARARARVAEMLELVGLRGMERRAVARLSGGEQQRVALARALAPSPALLMLDEPLGSLDRELRQRLPLELRAIFRTLGATVLYVTHDQEEALGVADRTIVLRDGRVEADGSPDALWARPPNTFVARFLGFRNISSARVSASRAQTPWGIVEVSPDVPDGEHTLLLRPGGFSPDAGGSVRGIVSARLFRGDHVRLEVSVAGAPPLEVDARWTLLPALGESITLRAEAGSAVVIPGGAGGEAATVSR
jgi:thiamine transport system ATP-binding protein